MKHGPDSKKMAYKHHCNSKSSDAFGDKTILNSVSCFGNKPLVLKVHYLPSIVTNYSMSYSMLKHTQEHSSCIGLAMVYLKVVPSQTLFKMVF
mgnify:FL=1